MTTTTLTWKASKHHGSTSYSTLLPDGRRVVIRATGQRNGRVLGGAWIATTGWPPVTLTSAGTLRDCQAQVEATIR